MTRRRSRSRRRGAAKIAGANAAGLLAILVAAELVFGNWIFGPEFGFLNIRHGERHRLDVSEFIPGGGIITYTRDEYGLRGDYGGDPKNIDILVIGGSTTNERFIDDADIWTARLQENFERAGAPVKIANGGIDGQSSRGHIKAFELWFPGIPGLKPKFVLAYMGINDTAVAGAADPKFDDMKSPELLRRVRHYVMNHSVLYNQFRQIRGIFKARDAKLMHGGNSFKSGVWTPVNDFTDLAKLKTEQAARLGGYRRRLETLAGAIRAFGAEPIFVTQPVGEFKIAQGRLLKLMQPSDLAKDSRVSDGLLKTMNLFNGVTLAACAKLKARCADLARRIQFKDGDFYDALHTTPAGSKRIADFLFGTLEAPVRAKISTPG